MKKIYSTPAIEQFDIILETDLTLKISTAKGLFEDGEIADGTYDPFFDDVGPGANSGDFDEDESISWFDY